MLSPSKRHRRKHIDEKNAQSTELPREGRLQTHQTATMGTLRPDATTRRFMSSGSLVRIVACWRRAIVTTTASMTSAVPLLPSSRPASRAELSSRGTTAQPVKNRLSWACFGDRLTWATTGAGTAGTTPSSKRALCSAQVRRSFRSAATRTAASYTTLFTRDAGRLAPFAVAPARCGELHPSLPR